MPAAKKAQPPDDAPDAQEAPQDPPEAASPAAGDGPRLVWFQAPGHVIGFTEPLDAVIQGQVDSGFLTPADPPE